MNIGESFHESFKCLEEIVNRSLMVFDKTVSESLKESEENIIRHWK